MPGPGRARLEGHGKLPWLVTLDDGHTAIGVSSWRTGSDRALKFYDRAGGVPGITRLSAQAGAGNRLAIDVSAAPADAGSVARQLLPLALGQHDTLHVGSDTCAIKVADASAPLEEMGRVLDLLCPVAPTTVSRSRHGFDIAVVAADDEVIDRLRLLAPALPDWPAHAVRGMQTVDLHAVPTVVSRARELAALPGMRTVEVEGSTIKAGMPKPVLPAALAVLGSGEGQPAFRLRAGDGTNFVASKHCEVAAPAGRASAVAALATLCEKPGIAGFDITEDRGTIIPDGDIPAGVAAVRATRYEGERELLLASGDRLLLHLTTTASGHATKVQRNDQAQPGTEAGNLATRSSRSGRPRPADRSGLAYWRG